MKRAQLALIFGSSVALGIALGSLLYQASSPAPRKARPAQSPALVLPSPRPNTSLEDEPVCQWLTDSARLG